MRRCGSTPSFNAVGLLDEHDAQSRRMCGARRSYKVSRLYASARAVTENERGPRLSCVVQVRVRDAERRVDLERLHGDDAATSFNPGGAAP